MKIIVGSDHGGYDLKNQIIEHLKARGIEVEDLGCYSTESVDYPEYGQKVAKAVAAGVGDKGIICCGTGIGISIAANKVKGIRCALPYDEFTAEMCKRHNDANIVSFGGRTLAPEKVMKLIDIWLDTEFEGGRHERRVNMLNEL